MKRVVVAIVLSLVISLSVFQVVLLTPNVRAVTNLLNNPSFELGGANPTSWKRLSSGTIDSYFENAVGEAQTGTYSAYVETNGGVGFAGWQSDFYPTAGNKQYSFSTSYTSSSISSARVFYKLSNGTETFVELGKPVASANKYSNFTQTFTTPVNTVSLAVSLGYTVNGWMHVDNGLLVDLSGGTTSSSSSSVVVSSSSSTVSNSSSSVQSSSSPTQTGVNSILNPSFETVAAGKPSNWAPLSSGTLDSYFDISLGETPYGTNSAYVETNGGAGFAAWQTNFYPSVQGANYTLTSNYIGTGGAVVRAFYKSSTGAVTTQDIGATVASTGIWRAGSWNFTTPANTSQVAIAIGFTNGTNWMHVDNFSLVTGQVVVSSSSSSQSSQPTGNSDLPIKGRWKPTFTTSVVGIQSVTLPGGKIMLFDGSEGAGVGDNKSLFYDVYTTATGTIERKQAKDSTGNFIQYALFCAGMASLTNGTIFFAGGDVTGDAYGSLKSAVYSAANDAWTQTANMMYKRWYPSSVQTNDGRVLTVGGTQTNYQTPAKIPEVFSFVTNSWTQLTGALDNFDQAYGGVAYFYPWLFELRSGKVANLGPKPTITKITTTGAGAIQNYGTRDLYDNDGSIASRLQQYGNVARISPDEVLTVGGGLETTEVQNSSLLNPNDILSTQPANTATIVRLDQIDSDTGATGTNPTVTTETGKPVTPRANAASVILPSGNVFLTGGSKMNEGSDRDAQYDQAALVPELWNKATGVWTQVAAHVTKRIYHMTAMLQIDGTVLMAGGSGFNAQCTAARGVNAISVKGGNACKQAEIYEPGYLFDSTGNLKTRPTITSINQTTVAPANTITLTSSSQVQNVTLVKPGIMTHGTNLEQYFVKPTTSGIGTNSVSVTMPADYYSLPKGKYFVFVWDQNGTPSVAKEITVQ
jgi:galactose oxidase